MQNSYEQTYANHVVGNTAGIRIVNFYAIPSKDNYNDMYSRSYGMNVNSGIIITMEDLFHRSHVKQGAPLNAVDVARRLPNVFGVKPVVDKMTNIVHGWGTRRLMFILVAESMVGGGTMLNYIQGYTEYHDPSFTGKLDPHMKFYINSVTNVDNKIDPMTGRKVVRPISSFNVLTDHTIESVHSPAYLSPQQESMMMIRPSDILDHIDHGKMYEESPDVNIYNYAAAYGGNENVVCSKVNNNPITHFTRTVNGVISGKSMSDFSHDMSDVLSNASSAVSEDNILSTAFIAAIYNITGNASMSWFTLDLLDHIDPNASLNVYNDGQFVDTSYTYIDSNNSEVLHKSNIESTIAYEIAQSVPSFMASNLLAEFAFSITNITGVPIVAESHAASFIDDMDITSFVAKVRNHVLYILYPTISKESLLTIDAQVYCNILGDTNIYLSVNNAPHIMYRFPTFADSLYNSNITTADNRSMISNDVGTFIDLTYQNYDHISY